MAAGLVIPEILVNRQYRKENQSKTIQYIDLDKYHLKINLQKKVKDLFERNKNIFTEFRLFITQKLHLKKLVVIKNMMKIFLNN